MEIHQVWLYQVLGQWKESMSGSCEILGGDTWACIADKSEMSTVAQSFLSLPPLLSWNTCQNIPVIKKKKDHPCSYHQRFSTGNKNKTKCWMIYLCPENKQGMNIINALGQGCQTRAGCVMCWAHPPPV